MRKVGTTDFIKDYMGKLDATLERLYQSYNKANKFKLETERENRRENIKRALSGGAIIVGTVAVAILKALF